MHIPPSEDLIPKELFGQVWRQYGSEEVAPSDRGRAKRKKPRAGARLVRKDSVQRVGLHAHDFMPSTEYPDYVF